MMTKPQFPIRLRKMSSNHGKCTSKIEIDLTTMARHSARENEKLAGAPFAFIKIMNAMFYVWLIGWLAGLCVNARYANRGRVMPTECM